MRFAAKQATDDFEPVPAGNHFAICNAIIDLGVQPGRGQYPTPRPEVYIRFELPTERISYEKGGKQVEGPMSIGRTFTASMSEKANLRKFVEGLRGKKFASDVAAEGFEFSTLLGAACLLNVTHNDNGKKVYANIDGAAPVPKGMSTNYNQANESLFYDLTNPEADVYGKLPKWLKEKIDGRLQGSQPTETQRQVEQRARQPAVPTDDDFQDEVPF